jgi:hypothetical protein
VLRRIFGPKWDEETGGWRTLHNEELHNLYSSPSIIRIIKSRKMRWAGHVARMGERRNALGYWWESRKERNHWENQDVGWWSILKWILERQDGIVWKYARERGSQGVHTNRLWLQCPLRYTLQLASMYAAQHTQLQHLKASRLTRCSLTLSLSFVLRINFPLSKMISR